jgi:hypothetical protein
MTKSNEVTYKPEANYLESLQNFGEHVNNSLQELLTVLDNDGVYQKRFDIKIEMNGQSTTIEFHADAYERLTSMVEAEISEYIQLHGGGSNE